MIDRYLATRNREADLLMRQLAVLDELKRVYQIDIPLERRRLETALGLALRNPRAGSQLVD